MISSKGKKRTYVACACKNLERDGFRLSGASVVGYGNSRNPGCTKNPSFDTLSIISDYAYGISEQEIRKFYAEQFVVDAFLGNTDRNNRSWGFLSKPGEPPRIAPVFGCSSCLCPSVREDELSEQRAVMEALNGISVIRNQDGNQIPYKQFLFSCRNEDVDLALLKIVPRIEISEIFEMIANTPYVSTRRKEFYCNYLLATYKRVLVPAFEKVNKNS
ncbi:MAG: hypothetical protein LIO99_08700 [Clostridiales bacterium]|nr:hypothetical protein [Clostridiales bacterium]